MWSELSCGNSEFSAGHESTHLRARNYFVYVCIYVCIYAFMYACMYVLAHMCLYMYVNAPSPKRPYLHFIVFGVFGITFLSAIWLPWQGSGVCRQPYQANSAIIPQIKPQILICILLLMRYNTNKWRGWYWSEGISALRKQITHIKFSNDICSHIRTRSFLCCLKLSRSYSNIVHDIRVDFYSRSHQNYWSCNPTSFIID